MTNRRTTPNKKQEFVQAIQTVKSLDDLFNTVNIETRAEVRDGAMNAVLATGYNYQLAQQTTDAEKAAFLQRYPNPGAMPLPEASTYAKTYQEWHSRVASTMLVGQGALEEIVKGTPEDKLEALATSKETAPLLARNVSEDYAHWFQAYTALKGQKHYFGELAKKDELSKEDRENFKKNMKVDLDEYAANVLADAYLVDLVQKGPKFDRIFMQSLRELKKKSILMGIRDEKQFADAQKKVLTDFAEQSDKAYKAFEKEDKGKHSLANYVAQGLAPMIAGSTDDHLKARDLLYRTVA